MNPRTAAHHRSVRILIAFMVAGALTLFAMTTTVGANPWSGVPSPAYWATHTESESKTPVPVGVYQPNTDTDYLTHVQEANRLALTGRPWRNVGPFGGVQELPNVGDGSWQLGPVGGIGTAIAVDPTDHTGNTVYLGGFGGLYKSTNGGATMTNITDGKLARYPIGAVAVDPHDGKTVYVGTGVSINTLSDDAVGSGVYVTHDGGKTFTRPSANTHGYGVNAIVVSPNGTVFVGTNYGLWRSTDHGASFQKIALPDNADHTAQTPAPLGSTVSAIVVRPGDPNEVTVAVGWARGAEELKDAQGNVTVIAPGNGLYRSATNGAPGSFKYLTSTSQLTWAGATSDPVGRTSLSYGNGDVMWALVQDAGRNAGKNPASLPDLPNGTSGTVYSAIFGTSVLNGLYRSADDGATWQLEATTQTLATALGGTSNIAEYSLYAAGAQAQYNNWVVADPTDINKVYIGLEEIYAGTYRDPTGSVPAPSMTWMAAAKYADACGFLTYPVLIPGQNGVSCPGGVPLYTGHTSHPDQHAVALAQTPTGLRMYSGNDGGWWVEDAHALPDGSTGFDSNSWRSLNQPATVLPWDVAMLQDGTVIMALQDNGTIHIRKDGTAYSVCGGDGVVVYPGKDAQSYYCGIPGVIILGTTDDFQHTTVMSPPGTANTSQLLPFGSFLSPWMVDPTNPDHLLAAAGSVTETTAGINSDTLDPTSNIILSTSWTTVFTPPTRADMQSWDSSAATTRGAISYVGMCASCRPSFAMGNIADPAAVNPAIATNVQKGCTAAPASTACWHLAASKGLPHQQVSGIAVDPKDPRTIYVSLRQELVMTSDPHITGVQKVMVSHDAGETFTDITGDLPRVDAQAITLRNGQLIVATDVGIFISQAGSTHWIRLGTGLPEVPFRSMKLDLTGRYLVAGAYGRGAWVYDFGSKAASPALGGGTVVAGKKITGSGSLPATGTESTLMFALALLVAAAVLSARLRGTR